MKRLALGQLLSKSEDSHLSIPVSALVKLLVQQKSAVRGIFDSELSSSHSHTSGSRGQNEHLDRRVSRIKGVNGLLAFALGRAA